jgi:hypothetical protein
MLDAACVSLSIHRYNSIELAWARTRSYAITSARERRRAGIIYTAFLIYLGTLRYLKQTPPLSHVRDEAFGAPLRDD